MFALYKRFLVRLCERYILLLEGRNAAAIAKKPRPQTQVFSYSLIGRIYPSNLASSLLPGDIANSTQATNAGGGWCRRHVCF